MDYSKYYTFDEKKYITKVPLPSEWYSIGTEITLGSYTDENSAIFACVKYFNKIRPPHTEPGNLGTDVKGAVIYAQSLEIESLNKEFERLKDCLHNIINTST